MTIALFHADDVVHDLSQHDARPGVLRLPEEVSQSSPGLGSSLSSWPALCKSPDSCPCWPEPKSHSRASPTSGSLLGYTCLLDVSRKY